MRERFNLYSRIVTAETYALRPYPVRWTRDPAAGQRLTGAWGGEDKLWS